MAVYHNCVSTSVSLHDYAPDTPREPSDSVPEAHKLFTSAGGILQFTADFYVAFTSSATSQHLPSPSPTRCCMDALFLIFSRWDLLVFALVLKPALPVCRDPLNKIKVLHFHLVYSPGRW